MSAFILAVPNSARTLNRSTPLCRRDGDYCAASSTDSSLKLWSVNQAECVRTFTGHTNEKNFVGLTANGDYMACGSENSSVCMYYKALSKPVVQFKFNSANPATVRRSLSTTQAGSMWRMATDDVAKRRMGNRSCRGKRLRTTPPSSSAVYAGRKTRVSCWRPIARALSRYSKLCDLSEAQHMYTVKATLQRSYVHNLSTTLQM